MKLLTQAIINSMPGPLSQAEVTDPIVHVKFFSILNGWRWYAYEGWKVLEDGTCVPLNYKLKEGEVFEKDDNGNDWVFFFGKVYGFEAELGSFTLNELEDVVRSYGYGIERDRHFKKQPLSKVNPERGN